MDFYGINKILNTYSDSYSFHEEDNDQYIKVALDWIQSKRNIIVLYDKLKVKKYLKRFNKFKEYEAEIVARRVRARFIEMATLLGNRDYTYKVPDFYLVFLSNKKIFIFSITFKSKIKMDAFLDIFALLQEAAIKKKYIEKFDNIFVFFPFKVGNIFSKKRHIYEINSKYMDSLRSSRSLDKDKNTVLKNYIIDKDYAAFSEYHDNNSLNYNSHYAYIDFVNLLICAENIPTYYFNNLIESESFRVLNSIDSFYFHTVLNQQDEVYLSIAHQIRISENIDFEGAKYSFEKLLERFITEINENKNTVDDFRKLNKYLKDMKQKSKLLYTLQKLFKSGSLDKWEKILFDKVAINFPLYDNKAYALQLADTLNKLDYKNKIEVNSIVELIFGRNSILYDKDDKRKIFFKDVKKLFSIYHNSEYEQENLKYLFNKSWIASASKILKGSVRNFVSGR